MVVYILGYLNVVSVAIQRENFHLEEYCHRTEVQQALRICITPLSWFNPCTTQVLTHCPISHGSGKQLEG